jgi:hypothetical protein
MAGTRDLSVFQSIQTGSGMHLSLCLAGNGGCLPGGKVATV